MTLCALQSISKTNCAVISITLWGDTLVHRTGSAYRCYIPFLCTVSQKATWATKRNSSHKTQNLVESAPEKAKPFLKRWSLLPNYMAVSVQLLPRLLTAHLTVDYSLRL